MFSRLSKLNWAWTVGMLAVLYCGGAWGATTRTWNGGGGDNNWTTAANWGGTAPVAGDDLHFAGIVRLTPNNDFGAGTSFNSITFDLAAGNFVLGGNALTLAGGASAIANNATAGTMTISTPITFSTAAPTIACASGGTLTVGATIDNGTLLVTVNSIGTTNLTGVISNTGGLTKSSSGTLQLAGASANTYSGTTTVNDGILQLNKTATTNAFAGGLAIGDGTGAGNSAVARLLASNQIPDASAVSINTDGQLDLNGQSDTIGNLANTNPGNVTGAGTLTVSGTLAPQGAGINTLSTTNIALTGTYQVQMDHSAAPTTDLLDAGTSNITLTGSTLSVTAVANSNFGNSYVIAQTSGGGAISGTFTGLPNAATFTAAGRFFQINYTATAVTLTDDPQTYIWTGSVSANWNNPGNWDNVIVPVPGSDLRFPSGATNQVNSNNNTTVTTFNSITFTGSAGGAGYVLIGSGFTLAAGIADSCTVAGHTNTVSFASAVTLGAAQSVSNSTAGTTLSVTCNIINGANLLTVSGAGDVSIGGVIGAGAGGLTMSGTGTLTLSGVNTYTGATVINAGVLSVSSLADGLSSSNIGASTNAAGNLVLNGGTLKYTGAVGSTNRLFSVGTSGGTLDASGSGAIVFNNTGTIGFNAQTGARTFTLTGTSTAVNSLAAVIADNTGATSLVKSGAGTWQLAGTSANTQTGATAVNDGMLQLNNGAANGAIPGDLTIGDGTGAANSAIVQLASGGGQIANAFITSINSDGQLDLFGNSETIGSLAMTGGSVITGAGTLTLGGNVTGNAAATTATIAGNLSLGGAVRTFTIADGAAVSDMTISALISGAGGNGLTKAGLGTLTLTSGSSTYNGATTVNAGVLLVDGDISTSNPGVTVNSGGTLGGSGTVRNVTVPAGQTGSVSPGSSATATANLSVRTVSLSSAASYVVNLNGTGAGAFDSFTASNTVNLNSDAGAGSTLVLTVTNPTPANGDSYKIISCGNNTLSNSFSSGASISASGRTFTISYSRSGSSRGVTLIDSTSGPATFTWTGSGADTNWSTSGNWNPAATPTSGSNLVFPAGPVNLTANYDSVNFAPSTVFNTIQFTGGGYTLTGDSVTLTGGASALDNNVAGTNTVNNNLIFSTAAPTITCLGGGTLNVAGTIDNGTLLLTVSSAGTTNLNGVISNTGGLTKSGTGTLVLTAANTYTGATNVNAGTLFVSNSLTSAVTVAASATLAPGTPATVGTMTDSVAGGVTLTNSTSNFNLRLNGTVAGTSFDQLVLSANNATLALGSATLNLTLGYAPAFGDSYTIISHTGTGLSGTFNGLPEGKTFTQNARKYLITYVGGTGSSVVLYDVTGAFVWTGGASAFWNNAGNWDVGAVPGAGADLWFGSGAANIVNTNDIPALTSFNSITFSDTGYVMGGNPFDLGGGGIITTATAVTNELDMPVSFASTRTIFTNAGTLTLGGAITETAISGLAKNGTGTLVLRGASTFTGSTAINNGTLVVAGGNNRLPAGTSVSLGLGGNSGVLQLGDAGGVCNQTLTSLFRLGPTTCSVVGGNAAVSTLTLNIAAADGYDGLLGGGGANQSNLALTLTGGGTLALGGANTYSGGTTVSQGKLLLLTDGPVTAAGSGLITMGDAGTGAVEIDLILQGSSSWPASSVLNNNITVSNLPTGTILLGTGISNQFPGVFMGNVTLNNNISLQDVGSGTVNQPDRFEIDGVIQGTGNVTIEAPGNAALPFGRVTLSTNNTFTGNVIVNAGAQLQLPETSTTSIPATADVTVNGEMSFTAVSSPISVTIGGLFGNGIVDWPFTGSTASFTVGAGGHSGNFPGQITNALPLTKTGAGTQILSNATNDFSGATTVNGGILQVNGNDTSSSVTVNNSGMLVVNGTVTDVTVNNGGTLAGSGTIDGASVNDGGILSPSAGGTPTATMTTTSPIDFTSLAFYTVDLSGATASASISAPALTVDLGDSTLAISSYAGAANGNVFTIVSAGTVLGTFGALPDGSHVFAAGRDLVVNYTATAVTLTDIGPTTTYVWTGLGGNNLWSTGANWNGGVVPLAGSGLQFPSGAARQGTNNNDLALNFASITFTQTSGTAAYTLNGNGFTISSGIGDNATGAHTNTVGFSSTLTLAASQGFNSNTAGASLNVTCPVNNNGFLLVVGSGGNVGNVGINGSISGGGGLTMSGTGTLTLSGANTYGGDTTVDPGGTVGVGSGNAIPTGAGTGNVVVNGVLILNGVSITINGLSGNGTVNNNSVVAATFTVGNNNTSGNYSGVIQNAGGGALSVTKTGTGTLTLSGSNSFGGVLSVQNGTLSVATVNNDSANGPLGNSANAVVLGSAGNVTGTLQYTGASVSSSKTFTMAAGGTGAFQVDTAGTTLRLTGVIGGSGSLSKTAPGTLNMSGANTYSAGTALNAGTIAFEVSTVGAITSGPVGTGTLTIFSGTTVQSSVATRTVANAVTANGDFTVSGSQPLILSGTMDLAAGAPRTITVSNSALTTFSGAISNGALTKGGAGTLVLSGSSTYSGATVLNSGTLLVDSPGSIASSSGVSVNAGTTLGGTGTSGPITSTGGTVSPGDPTNTINTLTCNANVGLDANSIFEVQLDGTGPTADLLRDNNDTFIYNLDGNLNITSVAFSTNQSYTIIRLNGVNTQLNGWFKFVNGTPANASPAFNGQVFTNVAGSGRNLLIDYSPNGGVKTVSLLDVTNGLPAFTWSGASLTSNTWTDGNNWVGNNAPAPGTNLVFPNGALQLANVNDFAAGTVFNSIEFTGGGYSLSGNGVTLIGGAAALNNNVAGANTIGLPVAFSAGNPTIACASGGTLTLSGTVDNGGLLVTVNSVGNTNISGVLSGAGGLGKSGGGVLTLSGANTYGGATVLSAGTLAFGNDAALSTGALTIGGGTTIQSGGAAHSVGNAVAAAGDFTVGGSLALTLSGTINLNAGAPRTITVSNTALTTFSGVISNGALTKAGAGTLTLSGANNYAGDTTVAAGTLALGVDNVLPDGAGFGNVIVTGTLDMAGHNDTINGLSGAGAVDNSVAGGPFTLTIGNNDATSTFSGVIKNTAGTLALTKTGAGTLTLSGASTYSGGTGLNLGTLALANDAALGTGTLTISNGTTIQSSGAAHTVSNAVVTGGDFTVGGSLALTLSGTVDLGAGAPRIITVSNSALTTVSGVISNGALTKAGAGTLALSGANTYAGDTTVSAGTLALGANDTLPDGAGKGNVIVNGTLDMAGFNETINGLSGTGTVDNSAAGKTPTLTVGNNDASGVANTFGGVIKNTAGTLALLKTGAGNCTLTANNTYNGLTTVNNGTLTVQGTQSGSNAVINSGGVLVVGQTGTTGDVTVNAGGTLSGNGNVGAIKASGLVTPGIPGSLGTGGTGVIGTLTCPSADFSGGGTLQIRIPSSTAADKLAVTGTLTVGGTSQLVADLNGYQAADHSSDPEAADYGTLAGTPAAQFKGNPTQDTSGTNPTVNVLNNTASGKSVITDYNFPLGNPKKAVTIHVNTPPHITSAVAGADLIGFDSVQTFTVQVSDPDGNPMTYYWHLGDQNPNATISGVTDPKFPTLPVQAFVSNGGSTGDTESHTFSSDFASAYSPDQSGRVQITVTVTVDDGHGGFDSATFTFSLVNPVGNGGNVGEDYNIINPTNGVAIANSGNRNIIKFDVFQVADIVHQEDILKLTPSLGGNGKLNVSADGAYTYTPYTAFAPAIRLTEAKNPQRHEHITAVLTGVDADGKQIVSTDPANPMPRAYTDTPAQGFTGTLFTNLPGVGMYLLTVVDGQDPGLPPGPVDLPTLAAFWQKGHQVLARKMLNFDTAELRSSVRVNKTVVAKDSFITGKFLYSPDKSDFITFTGRFPLPSSSVTSNGNTVQTFSRGAPLKLTIGIGNVIGVASLRWHGDPNGPSGSTASGKFDHVYNAQGTAVNITAGNKLSFKFTPNKEVYAVDPRSGAVVPGHGLAVLSVHIGFANMSAGGFDTEGIIGSSRGAQVEGQRAVYDPNLQAYATNKAKTDPTGPDKTLAPVFPTHEDDPTTGKPLQPIIVDQQIKIGPRAPLINLFVLTDPRTGISYRTKTLPAGFKAFKPLPLDATLKEFNAVDPLTGVDVPEVNRKGEKTGRQFFKPEPGGFISLKPGDLEPVAIQFNLIVGDDSDPAKISFASLIRSGYIVKGQVGRIIGHSTSRTSH